MIIIPARSPIVLKSIASMACSCSSVWVTTTSPAPRSATLVRSIRSLAIAPSATAKMATASATAAYRQRDVGDVLTKNGSARRVADQSSRHTLTPRLLPLGRESALLSLGHDPLVR